MAEQLKNLINKENVGALATEIVKVEKSFDIQAFMAEIFDEYWDDLALTSRGNHITMTLGKFLPQDYPTAIGILEQVIDKADSFLPVSLTAFIPEFGFDEQHFDLSIKALKYFTQFGTSEFAVRPFIEKYEEKMIPIMLAWTTDENEHVRRLASEGCRPALPWGKALQKYKKDPTPILPILENLRVDESLYVRKSVANNLNDISKTHPELVVEIAQKWLKEENKHTDWIVKHACRTILKQGRPDALALFGYHDASAIEVTDFAIDKTALAIGEKLTFSFGLKANVETKIRLEFGIDYMKANGKQNRKVFQISETALKADEQKNYTKKHAFGDLSTRKHYAGLHRVTLFVNGAERGTLDFELTKEG